MPRIVTSDAPPRFLGLHPLVWKASARLPAFAGHVAFLALVCAFLWRH